MIMAVLKSESGVVKNICGNQFFFFLVFETPSYRLFFELAIIFQSFFYLKPPSHFITLSCFFFFLFLLLFFFTFSFIHCLLSFFHFYIFLFPLSFLFSSSSYIVFYITLSSFSSFPVFILSFIFFL